MNTIDDKLIKELNILIQTKYDLFLIKLQSVYLNVTDLINELNKIFVKKDDKINDDIEINNINIDNIINLYKKYDANKDVIIYLNNLVQHFKDILNNFKNELYYIIKELNYSIIHHIYTNYEKLNDTFYNLTTEYKMLCDSLDAKICYL